MLKRGFKVSLIDGGVVEKSISKEFSFSELKDNLNDPWSYFLGSDLEGITSPNSNQFFGMDDLINLMLKNKNNVGKYMINEYWLDIGVIDDYTDVEKAYSSHFK